jgi:hypothetical protein
MCRSVGSRIGFVVLAVFMGSGFCGQSGCTRATYDRVRLGETTAEQLPSVLGQKCRRDANWYSVQNAYYIPVHLGSVAVLTDENGRPYAKAMTSMTAAHWLLFMTVAWDQCVEMRLSDAEVRQVLREYDTLLAQEPTASAPDLESRGDRFGRRLMGFTEGLTSSPSEMLYDLTALFRRAETSSSQPTTPPGNHLTLEQIPLVLMICTRLSMPPEFPVDPRDEGTAAFGSLVFRFAALSVAREDLDKLLAMAESRQLLSSSVPLDFSSGPWRMRKIAQGHYELAFHVGDIAPPWAFLEKPRPPGAVATSQPAGEETPMTTPAHDETVGI